MVGADITHPDFPGERLVTCRNPALATERARKRLALLDATDPELTKIATAARVGRLDGAGAIGIRVGNVIGRDNDSTCSARPSRSASKSEQPPPTKQQTRRSTPIRDDQDDGFLEVAEIIRRLRGCGTGTMCDRRDREEAERYQPVVTVKRRSASARHQPLLWEPAQPSTATTVSRWERSTATSTTHVAGMVTECT